MILDFGKSLGLPDMSALKDVFKFNMNSITLNKVLDLLDESGITDVKTRIVTALEEVQVEHYY